MTIGITLALLAAVAYGTGNFVGGSGARRAPAMSIVFAGRLAGAAAMLVVPQSCRYWPGSPVGSDRAPRLDRRRPRAPGDLAAPNQLTGAFVTVVLATAMHQTWLPSKPAAGWGFTSGLLGVAGTLAFVEASHLADLGTVAVLASLYPAVTVMLARTVFS